MCTNNYLCILCVFTDNIFFFLNVYAETCYFLRFIRGINEGITKGLRLEKERKSLSGREERGKNDLSGCLVRHFCLVFLGYCLDKWLAVFDRYRRQ